MNTGTNRHLLPKSGDKCKYFYQHSQIYSTKRLIYSIKATIKHGFEASFTFINTITHYFNK